MLFRSALATSKHKNVENMWCAKITLGEKSNQRLHLLLCSLCATCWSEIMLVTCVESSYWDLPSSGPARCAQDTRRVLHDKPSRPKVLGDRTQGRHGNPFVRCGAPHRTSGVQKGGSDVELEQLANLTESFRGRDKLSNEYERTCGNTCSRTTSDNGSGTYIHS